MNSERLAQDPGTEEMPEAVRDEVGIVAAAFPARDRHGEENKGGRRRPERRRRCLHATVELERAPVELIVARCGADGGREGNVAPAEAVRPGRAAEAAAATRLDHVENCRDDSQRPDAQRSAGAPAQRPRGRGVGDVRR